jgi:hypothetical protein
MTLSDFMNSVNKLMITMCITSYLHAYENEIPCPSLLRLLSSRNTKNEAETGEGFDFPVIS